MGVLSDSGGGNGWILLEEDMLLSLYKEIS
jgi:hypothetical protein